MVGNEEGRVVSTEIEKNPAQGSNLKVPNTKVILFCVAAFLLIVAYILMSAMFQGQKQRNAEDSSVKKGTSFSANDAESIIGGRDFGLTQPLQIPSVSGVSGEKEQPAAPVTDESNHDQKLELHQPIEPKFTLQAPPAVDDVNDQMEQQEAMQIRQLKIETDSSKLKNSELQLMREPVQNLTPESSAEHHLKNRILIYNSRKKN